MRKGPGGIPLSESEYELAAMELVSEELRKTKAQRARAEADPTLWTLKCPLCTKRMVISTTRREGSYHCRCPLCGSRLFFYLPGWKQRHELQRAAQLLDKR